MAKSYQLTGKLYCLKSVTKIGLCNKIKPVI